jgi:hypothetical protein
MRSLVAATTGLLVAATGYQILFGSSAALIVTGAVLSAVGVFWLAVLDSELVE